MTFCSLLVAIMKKDKIFYCTFIVILVLGAFLRYDAFVGTHKRVTINFNMARQGAAISLFKGWGYKVYPIPDYRDKGRMVDPEEYLQWEKGPDGPENLPFLYLNPGPPTMLALTYKLFGLKHQYYQIFQLTITFLQILLIFYIGRVIFDSRSAGLFAAFLSAVSLFDLNYSMYLGREIYTNTGLIISMAGSVYLIKHHDRGLLAFKNLGIAALLGLGLAFCLYFKKTSLPYFVLMPFCVLIFAGYKKAIVFGSVCVTTGFLVLLPWMIRNANVTGEFRLSKETEFLAVFGGIGSNPNSIGQSMTDTVALRTIALQLSNDNAVGGQFYGKGSMAYDKKSKEVFFKYLAENPNSYLQHYMANLKSNFFEYTDWPYYDFGFAATPKLANIKRIFGQRVHEGIKKAWRLMITVIPYFSVVGLVFGVIFYPRSFVLISSLVISLLFISIVVGHHCKYSYHILTIHYINSGFILSVISARCVEFFKRRKPASFKFSIYKFWHR